METTFSPVSTVVGPMSHLRTSTSYAEDSTPSKTTSSLVAPLEGRPTRGRPGRLMKEVLTSGQGRPRAPGRVRRRQPTRQVIKDSADAPLVQAGALGDLGQPEAVLAQADDLAMR